MKNSILFLAGLILFFFIGQAKAQQNPLISPEEKAQQAAEHMQKRLGLKEFQLEQIYSLNLNKIQKARTVQREKANHPQKLDKHFKKINEEYNTRLRSVLTPEQYQRWELLKNEAQARRQLQQSPSSPALINNPETELEGLVTL